jgi:hypothetical protein
LLFVSYFFGVPGPARNQMISPNRGNNPTSKTQSILLVVSALLPKIWTSA